MRAITEEAIHEIVTAIIREFQPSAVYLFGSRARGDASETSDIDLLVITREPFTAAHSRRKELARLWRLVARFRLPVDVLLYSQQELGEWQTTPSHILARAVREGRPLYAAA